MPVIDTDPSVQLFNSPGSSSVPWLGALPVGHVNDASLSIDPPPVKRALDAAVADHAIRKIRTHVWAVGTNGADLASAVAKQHYLIPSDAHLRRPVGQVFDASHDVPRLWVGRRIRRFTLSLETAVSAQRIHTFLRARM